MFLDPLLYGFVLVGLFTPGPNVIMLTTSGVRFGFLRSLPHLFGVVVGVGITAGVTALGVGVLVTASPILNSVLRLAAVAFNCGWPGAIGPRRADRGPPVRPRTGRCPFWGRQRSSGSTPRSGPSPLPPAPATGPA